MLATLALLISVLFTSHDVPQQYYVDTYGSDTLCNGTQRGSTVNAPDCSFKTLQKAFDTMDCTLGDDVDIGPGGFPGQADLKSVCQCPGGGNECVISGDPTLWATRLLPGPNDKWAIGMGNISSSSRTRNVRLSNLTSGAGYEGGIFCGDGRYCTEIYLDRVNVGGLDYLGLNEGGASVDAAITFDGALDPNGDNITIANSIIFGNRNTCWDAPTLGSSNGARLCGARTNAIYANTYGVRIINTWVEYVEGYYARVSKGGIIEGGSALHVWGGLDDGLIQIYNADDVIIRRNRFMHCNAENESFAIVKMRRTVGSGGKIPGVEIYNNTFVSEPTVCSGPTSSCPPNSFGSNIKRVAIRSAKDGTGQGPYGEFISNRNIFVGFRVSPTILVQDGGSPSICPDPLRLDGDVFYNNTDPVSTATCTGDIAGYDLSEVQVDPLLDVDYAPTAGSPACNPGGSQFTARDGDVSDPWAGALQGACQ